jgi:short-subunit dehydrogenase
MAWNYNQKTALITGASSGIGEVFARELAKKGCHLILVARSQKKLEQLAHELQSTHSIRAVAIPTDLTHTVAPQKLAEDVASLGLTVDILINNAGFGTLGTFDQVAESRILQEIQLNVTSLTELTHLFIGPMIQRHSGLIINVASMTAFQPVPFMAVYGATKAYVLSFTEALWAENHGNGVQVLALCPGETKSSFHVTSGSDSLKSKRMEPIEVVNAAFEAVEQDRSYKIAGRNNYVMAQFPRFLPRRIILNYAKRVFRPVLAKQT